MSQPEDRLSFRLLLFERTTPEQSTGELKGKLAQDLLVGMLPGVSKALLGTGLGEVARVVDGLLGTDVSEVVYEGWRRYAALKEAALRTRQSPGSREAVELATRKISSKYEPRVDIYLDGDKKGEVRFTLELKATTVGMVGIVAETRLIAIEAGHVDLEGRLSCEGNQLVKRGKRVDLAGELPLGEGIPLLQGQ